MEEHHEYSRARSRIEDVRIASKKMEEQINYVCALEKWKKSLDKNEINEHKNNNETKKR